MTPNEFMIFYVILPWGLAILGALTTVIAFALGGPELITLMKGRMDSKAQFVFSWVDGGQATLEKYHPFEHGVLEENNKFLLYATPLSDKSYQPTLITLEQVLKAMPEISEESAKQMVEAENLKRLGAAKQYAEEMPTLNEASKAQCTFAGKPCWLGHRSIGVAMTPSLLELAEKNRRRIGKKATQSALQTVNVDTIKDFLTMNFSPRRLFQIWRSGEDAGIHGRPKKPFPMLLIIILFGALLFLAIGALIVTGKIDLGGFAKGILGN